MAQLRNTTISDTGSLNLPAGTTAQRPASPQAGMIRYNTTIADTEYYDGSAWRPISDSFPLATGGTVVDTDIGGVPYRIHLFTNTGNTTFTVTKGGEVEYLIVAGGGGGAGSLTSNRALGAGGAGGLLTGVASVTPQSYTVTVGAGGAGNTSGQGQNGQNSSAFNLTAIGGGGGGFTSTAGSSGGSGGGGGNSANAQGGAGIAGQGNAGGSANNLASASRAGGGGGGAGSAGSNGTSLGEGLSFGGNGGIGMVSAITGTNMFYAGGGGGGSRSGTPGQGGLGGGGTGLNTSGTASSGTNNTGGGGGGGASTTSASGVGGNGGSGIVIVRYRRNATTATAPDETRPSFLPFFYARDVRPIIARDGLVLDLDAANPLSYPGTGTTWTDLSGTGNNGTLINGVGYTSQNFGQFTFNGTSSQHINCGNDISLKPDYVTVEAWVEHTNPSQSLAFICGGGNTGAQGWWLSINPSINQVGFSCRPVSGGAQYGAIIGSTITNRIIHVAGSYNGSQVKIFFNGLEVFSANLTTVLNYTGIISNNVHIGDIGSSGTTSARFWTGNIYSVRVYNRGLSPQEIQQNFNATRGRYGI